MFGNTSIFECSHVQVHAAKNTGESCSWRFPSESFECAHTYISCPPVTPPFSLVRTSILTNTTPGDMLSALRGTHAYGGFTYPVMMPALAVGHGPSRRMKNATARLSGVDLSIPKRLNGCHLLQVILEHLFAYCYASRPRSPKPVCCMPTAPHLDHL